MKYLEKEEWMEREQRKNTHTQVSREKHHDLLTSLLQELM